jgi:uncharacterized protein (DUF1778 family)
MAAVQPSTKVSSSSNSARLEARVSPELKDLIVRAAALQDRTLTDFIIGSVHSAAIQAIKDNAVVELDATDSLAFSQALLNSRPLSDRLVAAAARHNCLIEQ